MGDDGQPSDWVLAPVRQLRSAPPKSRRRAMLDDPALTKDLLLVGLVMDELFAHREFRYAIIKDATGLGGRLDMLLRGDIPRYVPPDRPRQCMVKGPRGGKCPRSASHGYALHDPVDGTVTWIAGCELTTHFTWAEAEARRHKESAGAVAPLPVYNHRSLLAPHFPDIRWTKWWAKFPRHGLDPYDPARDPVNGTGEIAFRVPVLRVVEGDRGVS